MTNLFVPFHVRNHKNEIVGRYPTVMLGKSSFKALSQSGLYVLIDEQIYEPDRSKGFRLYGHRVEATMDDNGYNLELPDALVAILSKRQKKSGQKKKQEVMV